MISFPVFNETALPIMATVASAVFVAELTDKDAFLLLTLATRHRSWFVFAAGAVTFTITTAIIATSGYFLVNVFPVYWIKFVGGVIMIGYGFLGFLKVSEKERAEEEEKLLARTSMKSMWPAFLAAVSMLALLDLAGDATEVLIIVFVAHFDVVLVFASALIALIAATAVETVVGNRLRNYLSLKRLRLFSLLVFTIIGATIIITTIL